MGYEIISSNILATTGDAFTGSGFFGFLVSTGVLVSTSDNNGSGVNAGNDNVGYVYGTVFGGEYGVTFGSNASALVVGASGSIAGDAGGLFINGGFSTLTNAGVVRGHIFGAVFGGAHFPGHNLVSNSGTIACDGNGNAALSVAGGGNHVANSGTVSGAAGVIFSSAATDAANVLVNSGLIDANYNAFTAGDAPTTFTNTGTVSGGVVFGANDDTLVNKGAITGNVTFGGGGAIANPFTGAFANFYDGSAGSVTGTVFGGAANNVFTGGAGTDIFNFTAGGTDIVNTGAGDDRIDMGAKLFAADWLDGGAGYDTVTLNGDYSTGLTFGATTMVNVEELDLASGFKYRLTMNNATVAAGQTLTVDASALGPSDSLTLDASAETDGFYAVTGGVGADTFVFTPGHFSAADTVAGGGGGAIDTLRFSSAGTISAGALANVSGVERIALANGVNSIALTDSLVTLAANSTLTVVGGSGADKIDASKVTTATNVVAMYGGQGVDTLIAGGGADRFIYNAASESTGAAYDTIVGANFAHDLFNTPGAVGTIKAINAAVTSGALSSATFNANLAAAIGAAQLGAHDAVLFKASTGALAGQTFLIADLNGMAGYQANADLVIHLTGQTGTLTAANFV